MEIWEALVLGLIQGASEFLPISSSGHLLLLEKLGIGQENLFFNIMLHVGTLLAVLIAMRKQWTPLVKHPINATNRNLVLACIPTVALALVLKFLAPSLIDGKYLGCGFVLTTCLLYAGENLKPTESRLITAKTSILTGVLQGIAVLPGVSRSGATISALTLQGVNKKDSASFSFLLSIPIIIGSALYEGVEMIATHTAPNVSLGALLSGMFSAFFAGLISIKFFLKLIEKHSTIPFAIYTLLLGITISILPFFI